MSIQINESDWRPMTEPMTFPALVQYDNGGCIITGPCVVSSVMLRWQPFTPPKLPKKDADEAILQALFGGYNNDMATFSKIALLKTAKAVRSDERKRFSDGVEKLAKNVDGPTPYYVRDFIGDLRNLARGEEK